MRRLNVALYGTKRAGRLWGIKLNEEKSRWELRGLRWNRAFTSGTTLCTGAFSSSCTSTT